LALGIRLAIPMPNSPWPAAMPGASIGADCPSSTLRPSGAARGAAEAMQAGERGSRKSALVVE
jgi:hypothetical protein